MSSNYVPSDQNGNQTINGLLGVLAALGIFAILPLMHLLGSWDSGGPNISTESAAVQPPPPPIDEPPPPPEQDKDMDEPEMDEPPPPMTLAQLEMALEPGTGGATGDFGFGDYGKEIDALAGMQIFNLSDVDQKPSALIMSKPQYPYSMQQSKQKGEVVVEFVLDPEGNVHRARAVKSTNREFEQAAIDCVIRSTWNPAKKDAKPVACKVRIPILFSPR